LQEFPQAGRVCCSADIELRRTDGDTQILLILEIGGLCHG
jgi:hypothetical protein